MVNNRLCGLGIVTLTAAGNAGAINWYTDAGLLNLVNTGNTYSPSLTITTVYFVTVTNGSCTSSPTLVTASINTIPPPPAIKDTFICSGDQLILDAGNGYANYTWQDGSTNRTFIVTTPGDYSVEVGNSEGCTSSNNITVRLTSDCSDIYFPSAITPDGNGRNDFFGPLPFRSLSAIKNYLLVIYNRYGQVVFSTNDPLKRWDGKFNGAKYINTNYVWYASYLYRSRIVKKQKGNILVIR